MKKLFVTLLFAGFISFIPSSLNHPITYTLSAQIPSDGLVAWYPFNGNANDESGNGNNGVVNGATLTADRFGNGNSAYNFQYNLGQSIGGVNSMLPQGNNPITISAWFNLSSFPTNWDSYSVFSYGTWQPMQGRFSIIRGNYNLTGKKLAFGYYQNDIDISYNYDLNVWYNYTAVLEADSISFFVNGNLIAKELIGIAATNGTNFAIGRAMSTDSYMDGRIDDIAIYNRALSPSEIQQLYTTTSTTVGCNLGQIASVPTSICSGESVTLNATPGQSTQSNCFSPAVKSIGNAPQGSHKVVTDAQGNYYTTGTFTGSITVGNTTLTSSGNRDAFLVKYNNCGVVQWAIKGGSSGEQDYPYSMAVDASGNVYWVGRYNQTFTINGTSGSFTAPYTSTSNGNHQDGFLVKLDSSGGIVWGASCRGTSNDGFNGIALDNSGNPIVTGGFNGCCPSSFAVTIYGPNGNVGISSFGSNYGSGLIVKFDANGNILWKGSIYNRDTGLGSIAVDNNDNIYLTTSFRSWSNGTAAQFIDANNATYSIFNPGIGLGCLIKLNANGVYQWGQSFGNVGDGVGSLTSGTDVAIDANGNPWICGFYKGNAAVFYSTNNQNLELPAAATYRGFLAQYSAAGVPLQVVGHERSTGDTYFYGLARGNGKWGVVGTFSGQTNGGLDAMLVEFNDNLTVANAENTGSSGDDSWNSVVYNGTDFVLWGGMGGAATIANESVASASSVLWNRGGGSVVSNNNYTWSTGESNTSVTVSPIQTTTYTCTFSDGTNSCSDEVTVTVLPNVTNAISASIIEGESYILGTQTLTTAGTYTEVFTAANGCDSTVTLTLSVEPALTCNITATFASICSGNSIILTNHSTAGDSILRYLGQFNGHYYYSVETLNTIPQILNLCAAKSWNLAQITSDSENLFLCSSPEFNQSIDYLIDGSNPSGNTVILNSQVTTYTPWGLSEPNDIAGNETYIVMNGCYWYDVISNDIYSRGFIIESEIPLLGFTSWSTNATTPTITVSPTQTTTYTATVTTATQTCTDSITITVNPLLTWYADVDGDGFGETLTTAEGCDQPAGFVADNTDCNDADATVFPNAEEICFDGMDNNCDGVVDENCVIFGCTNPEACNFNVNATAEDGSCILPQPYFNCDGNCINDSDGDGVCDELEVSGCTDSTAFNFNPQATNDDGSCEAVLTCEITAPITTLCEGESVMLSVNTTGGASASSQLPANLQQGLVAYYPFNGNANDESGNGNNGTVNGATLTSDRFGNLSNAYGFNGLSDYISYNSTLNSGGGSRTLSLWYSSEINSSSLPRVLVDEGGSSCGSGFAIWNGNDSLMKFDNTCSPKNILHQFSANTWEHLVVVFDNSLFQNLNGVKFYVDGIEVLGEITGNNLSISTGINFPFTIGRSRIFNDGYFYHGKLDDIAIYNRALSASEIQQLYNAQSYAWSTNATTPTITVTPSQNTTYNCTVTQGNQTCTASVVITVNPNVTNTVSATIIEGETYTLGAQSLTTAGTYTEVFTSASGCDSTVTLTLAVEPLLTCEINSLSQEICIGEEIYIICSSNDMSNGNVPSSIDGFIGPFYNSSQVYFVSTFNANWFDARNLSQQYGGYLSVPNSVEESEFIYQLVYPQNQSSFWIGISDENQEDIWVDVNGDNIDYTNWAFGEPNNENDEDFGLVYIGGAYAGQWNDGHFYASFPFVIEFDGYSPLLSWSNNATTPTITVSPTQTTTYTATVTTATQTCTDSITITVNPLLTWYADADADGFGNPDDVVQDCNQPLGYIADNTDCNDEDAATYPGASEICDNNRDENCDGVDSLCFVPILGCTDINACNFNPEANTDDNSCILPQPETCNGLDDNCNGQVDEGLSVASINAVSAITALYPVCSGNSIRSANLNNGANSAVIEGSGNDLWFSINAQFNTLRAGLSAAAGDNDVRLYTMSAGGCLELIETEHEITSGNQVLLSDQLTVGQTYYVAVHNISGPMNASAKICFNHLTGSTCDHYYSNNTGIYTSVCNSFKAQYRANAVAYTFDILSATQNNVNQNITPWSYTTTSASTVVARLGTLLPANQGTAPVVYTLKVPVLYSLFDAAGNFENLFAQATTNCTVTLNAETTIALRSSDRCPTNKSLTSTIAPDRTVCGAMRYDWEFTEVLPNPGTAQVVQGGNYSTAFFLSNVPGITVGKTYNVRVRPVHSSGIAGQWGSVQCLRISPAGMMNHPGSADADPPLLSLRAGGEMNSIYAIYPNPTATGSFVLQYNGSRRGELTFAPDATTEPTFTEEMVMMDITGKVVFKTQVVIEANVVKIDFGSLASGVYVVMVGEERMRLVVQ